MDDRQAFKFAFLSRCLEDGLSPEESLLRAKTANDRFTKVAEIPFLSEAGVAAKGIANAAKSTLGYAVPMALMAPPLAGGAAAYVLNKATDADDVDTADIKRRELADAYMRMATQLSRQKALRDYKAQRQAPRQRPGVF